MTFSPLSARVKKRTLNGNVGAVKPVRGSTTFCAGFQSIASGGAISTTVRTASTMNRSRTAGGSVRARKSETNTPRVHLATASAAPGQSQVCWRESAASSGL
jgi:hypothetical protein